MKAAKLVVSKYRAHEQMQAPHIDIDGDVSIPNVAKHWKMHPFQTNAVALECAFRPPSLWGAQAAPGKMNSYEFAGEGFLVVALSTASRKTFLNFGLVGGTALLHR